MWQSGELGGAGIKFPIVMGHEATGSISCVGEGVTKLRVGKSHTVCVRCVLDTMDVRMYGIWNRVTSIGRFCVASFILLIVLT